MDINTIAERFCDCTLPMEEWTHEAHLKVGLWHLLRYSAEDSMNYLRDRIKKYNVVCGVKNTDTSGYHETITRFYVEVIALFLAKQGCNQPLDSLAKTLIEQWGDRKLILQYYSREKIMSKNARFNWVEPDLAQLSLQ